MKKITLLIATAVLSSSLLNAQTNVLLGQNAGDNITTGEYNVCIGMSSGNDMTVGNSNVFLGYASGFKNVNGYNNLIAGGFSAVNNTSGYSNVFLGYKSAYTNSTGANNVFIGQESGYFNTSGSQNVFTGLRAGYNNTTGYENVFIGNYAGLSNTTGVDNTFIGYNSGLNTTTGKYNAATGFESGKTNTTGQHNTYLGFRADANGSNYSHSSALGNWSLVTGSNMVRIGDQYNTYSIGGWQSWSNISDGRAKKNIQENVPGLEFIKKLRPVTYNMDYDAIDNLLGTKDDKNPRPSIIEKVIHTGFIAQEVELAANELGFDFDGVDKPKNDKDLYALRYAEFTVPLVKAVQELADETASLKKANNELLSIIDILNKRLLALEDVNKEIKTSKIENNSSLVAYMQQNSPNPFIDKTEIKYFIPETTNNANIEITSEQGILVMNITLHQKGNGSVIISGGSLKAGVYNCLLKVDGKSYDLKRIILVK